MDAGTYLQAYCTILGDVDLTKNKIFLCIQCPLSKYWIGMPQPLCPSGLIPHPADPHPIMGASQPAQPAARVLQWHTPALILTYVNVVLGLIIRTNCLLVSLQINISLPSSHSVVLPKSKSTCQVLSNFSRILVKASSADPPTRSVNQSL